MRPDAHDPFPKTLIQIDVDPLIDAIVRDSAVVFVGAGASVAAGLPLWNEFLRKSIKRAKTAHGNDDGWRVIDDRFRDGDLLLAAELLQQHLGTELETYIWDTFGSANRPSAIHKSIASIPFSLAITTNYDRLLEIAYRDLPPVLTWRDPDAILSAIKFGRRSVVKTHGDVSKPGSLVLTKTHYRDLLHVNEAFNACLSHLLAQRTFLFVGHGLRDYDILSLMDEARLRFAKGFGPHYAILFSDEADERLTNYLYDAYGIRVILCRPSDPKVGFAPDERTALVAQVLREIGGRVAELLHAKLPGVRVDDALFSQRQACEQLLANAVRLTGSFRGDICLQRTSSSTGQQVRAIEAFCLYPADHDTAHCEPLKLCGAPHLGEQIKHSSVTGRLYLQRHDRREDDFVYLADVCRSEEELKKQGFRGAKYQSCHSDVRSELAVPIYSDGMRVGVLNVESEEVGSYTRKHAVVLRKIADQIGWACYDANQRQRFSNPLKRYFLDDGVKDFIKHMLKSRLFSDLDLQFILWTINPIDGKLVAYFDREKLPSSSNKELSFTYRLEEDSLACQVLRERQAITIPDVDEALSDSPKHSLNRKGCLHFDIHGPITGTPVRSAGHTAAILVAWSTKGLHAAEQFREVPERLRRMAHLIANDPYLIDSQKHPTSRTDQFLKAFDASMHPHDQSSVWPIEKLRDKVFRQNVIFALMRLLLDDSVGIGRIRLWARETRKAREVNEADEAHAGGEKVEFRCICSITRPKFTTPQKEVENAYVGIVGDSKDAYVGYTISRFAGDPYARVQHSEMFGNEVDKNSQDLDKDPKGSWIVAPIVHSRRPRLLGYLSADNHRHDPTTNSPKADSLDDHLLRFQRYAMDVVSNLFGYLLPFEKRPVIPPVSALAAHPSNAQTPVVGPPYNPELHSRS